MPFGLAGIQDGPIVLFDRSLAVTIDTVRFTELDATFKIERTIKHEPNTCELKVWNLNEEHRARFEQLTPSARATAAGLGAEFATDTKKAKLQSANQKARAEFIKKARGVPVQIDAGYGDYTETVWLGDMRTVHTEREKTDWLTVLESGDGEKAIQNARINVSYGPKTPADTALRAMARAMGVGEGNLSQVVAKLRLASAQMYPRGTVFKGSVALELTNLTRAANLEWSIQNGALQFTEQGMPLATTALRISPTTGMIGAPTVDNEGICTVKMQMMPEVYMGRLLVIDSARIKGTFRIVEGTWQGDTSGGDWTIEVKAERYG